MFCGIERDVIYSHNLNFLKPSSKISFELSTVCNYPSLNFVTLKLQNGYLCPGNMSKCCNNKSSYKSHMF